MRSQKLISAGIMSVASLIGLGAFLYPFFLPSLASEGMAAHSNDAPLLTVVLIALCLTAVFANLAGRQMTSKLVAVLGILVAINAVLRAIPGPGGFNAIFFLPILAGYAYGPTFGFLLGSLSLLVSAFIGGGVGPWLPYQMFATGWMGLLSGFLPKFPQHPRWEPVLLAVWGGVMGLIFGVIMNIWFWPFMQGGVGATAEGGSFETGMAALQAFRNYAVFYVVTSLWWDAARAAGNALLLLLFGGAVLRVLRRFKKRFGFELSPVVHTLEGSTN
jgi:energy-coupling factor transport system substrate-specific component